MGAALCTENGEGRNFDFEFFIYNQANFLSTYSFLTPNLLSLILEALIVSLFLFSKGEPGEDGLPGTPGMDGLPVCKMTVVCYVLSIKIARFSFQSK